MTRHPEKRQPRRKIAVKCKRHYDYQTTEIQGIQDSADAKTDEKETKLVEVLAAIVLVVVFFIAPVTITTIALQGLAEAHNRLDEMSNSEHGNRFDEFESNVRMESTDGYALFNSKAFKLFEYTDYLDRPAELCEDAFFSTAKHARAKVNVHWYSSFASVNLSRDVNVSAELGSSATILITPDATYTLKPGRRGWPSIEEISEYETHCAYNQEEDYLAEWSKYFEIELYTDVKPSE